MMPMRLFVYGTLMRGGCRHNLLAGQRFISAATTTPFFALYDLGAYPGLVRCPTSGDAVHGELYDIDDTALPMLDRAEDAPDLYRREEIELTDLSRAVTYIYQRDVSNAKRITSGRWINKASPVS
jgi:gamma-glutamylcyclotransferase (GGCT)/AIG2-like uncharacterized protein YtfP